MAQRELDILSEDLQRAANRVVTEESLKFVAVHQKLKNAMDNMTSLRSQQILGIRELHEVSNRQAEEFDEDTVEEEKIRLREERDQLHKVLIKHKLFSELFQEAAFNTQMQNAVAEHINNQDKNLSPELRSTIKYYHENLQIGFKLSEAISAMEESERKILSLRIQYRTILGTIKNKWRVVTGMKSTKALTPEQRKTKEVKHTIGKLNKREDRLLLLVNLLQDLISSSGEKWGSNPRIVELMLLCDRASAFISGYEDIEDEEEIEQVKEKGKKNTTPKK